MSHYFHQTPFSQNPLETRHDLSRFLVELLDPLEHRTSPGGARIHLGHTGTHHDDVAAQLQAFSRPLWGLASLLAGGGQYRGTARWLDGFTHGSNPDSEEFWGQIHDRDQRMVECSAIGFSLAVAKEQLWTHLPPQAKSNLETWLSGINDKTMSNTSWLWFRVLANLGLRSVGSLRFDAERMQCDLDQLDTFYVDGGWSRDGPEDVFQLDCYSSSFAIQFAQLLYSRLAQDFDPARCEEYRNRAKAFAQDFIHYFDPVGRAIPFGRNMTYRFAVSSFWSALAFADVDLPAPLTWGVVKGLQLRNLRYWAKQPGVYNPDGTLTIGYCYPNLNLAENYNSPGSPYWCCQSFLALSLPEKHPFWEAKEEPYPELFNVPKFLTQPLHIAMNARGHTYILSSGQQSSYPLKYSEAKYGKFAYSSAFGYSVPTCNGTLEELGGDNTLAFSDDGGETWKCRKRTREAKIEGGKWLRSMWYPWADVEVETWLVPAQPEAPCWHIRVHRLKTSRALTSAEGGFAIYGQGSDERALEPSTADAFGVYEKDGEAYAISKAGVSGIMDIGSGERKGQVVRTDPNTNLIVSRAVLPTLMHKHQDSDRNTWLVSGVFALPSEEGQDGAHVGWKEEWEKRPKVPKEIMAKVMLMYATGQ